MRPSLYEERARNDNDDDNVVYYRLEAEIVVLKIILPENIEPGAVEIFVPSISLVSNRTCC